MLGVVNYHLSEYLWSHISFKHDKRGLMKQQLISDIRCALQGDLDNVQQEKLRKVLEWALARFTVTEMPLSDEDIYQDEDLLERFLASKQIEGCSHKSLIYYRKTIEQVLFSIEKSVCRITTDDLRTYLSSYQEKRQVSRVTVDNVRRILSSFFGWLEDEDYILKSPVRRIHRVKTGSTIKETYSDETLEKMRDACHTDRDLALIDFLASTGVRVGELVQLNRSDIDFQERSCIVFGKGNKEREVYFDARTKLHLQRYLASRIDKEPALFVSLKAPFQRLSISGIGSRLRQFGRGLGISKVHPHKFRRTLATIAIDKGMPIEQVQRLLGHQKIDTTMHYAMVKQSNVKLAHRKFVG